VTDIGIEDPSELAASLAGRRHPPARDGVAPSPEEVDAMVDAALGVPDHGYLRPFRFVVVSGEGRARLADALAEDMAAQSGRPVDAVAERARNKAYAAPCLVAVIASPHLEATIPEWEQLVSASCTGYAIVLAAQGLGLGSIWKSPAVRDGAAFARLFGLAPAEQLLGWVLVGSREAVQRENRREVLEAQAFTTTIGA
jgi:nitroreductase